MTNKKCLILFTVVFAAFSLFAYAQVWAQAGQQIPCERVRVFTQSGNEEIRVRFNATCENVVLVQFCDGGWNADGECLGWRNARKFDNPVLCTCTAAPGYSSACTNDLQENLNNRNDTTRVVVCTPIEYAGNQGRGCPVYNLPSYYYGGSGYR